MKKLVMKAVVMFAMGQASMTYSVTSQTNASDIHKYLWANYHQFSGHAPEAHKWYQGVLESGSSIYAYKGYVHFLHDIGQFQQILVLIPKLSQIFSDDVDLQLIFSQTLLNAGKVDEADKLILGLQDKNTSHQEVSFQAAQIYLRRKEPEQALAVIDKYFNNSVRRPNDFIFHFFKSQIYMQLNCKHDALASVRRSVEMYPRFDKGWLLFAMLEEQAGNLEQAIKGYSAFLELTNTNNNEVHNHLLSLMFKQKLAEQNSSNPINTKGSFEKTLLNFKQQNFHQALGCVDECLVQQPADVQARLLKIQILAGMNQYKKAADVVKDWIEQEPHNTLWYQTLHTLCRMGLENSVAIDILQKVAAQDPQLQYPTLYMADLYLRSANTDKAMEFLHIALDKVSDAVVKTKILYQIAIIHYEHQRYAEMKTVLEQGLQLQTDYPPLLNLLSYYYATKGNNLILAQKYIDVVLKQDKDNPHFLDTQARIYYKQELYYQAQDILERIAQKAPDDITILKHLSKTLFQQGLREQAQTIAQNALTVAQTSQEKNKIEHLLKRWSNKNT